jgi:hypothetical protein
MESFLRPSSVLDLTDSPSKEQVCLKTIEAENEQLSRFWPLVDYKEVLQMRKMPVGAMVLTANDT